MTDPRAYITAYFQGERAEMISFLAFAAVLVVAAILLWTTRDAFARPLAIVLMACAAVSCSVAIPLLLRDGPHKESLLKRIEGGEVTKVLQNETARMETVVRNYPYYRYLYAAAILAVVVMMLIFRNATTLGVSVGLLVFAATGLAVDHYSETRAEIYLSHLKDAHP